MSRRPSRSAPLAFDAATHTYATPDGRIVPHVTEILTAVGIAPVYRGDRWYGERGQRVHAACAILAHGKELEPESIDPAIAGFVESFRKLFAVARPRVMAVEQIVFGAADEFAGTADLIITERGGTAIWDYKTSAPAKWHPIQAALYALAVGASRTACVYLHEDGRIGKLARHEGRAHFEAARAAVTVYYCQHARKSRLARRGNLQGRHKAGGAGKETTP